jgi:hypothetical protein
VTKYDVRYWPKADMTECTATSGPKRTFTRNFPGAGLSRYDVLV